MRVPVLIAVALAIAVGGAAARAAEKNGVSPQAISLPSGPGSIEGLGESFEPQLNTGTSSWGVPLEVPPGRKGFAPALRLAYEGGSGSGGVGIGWRISGIAFVQRQTDKGLPRYDESATFNGSDTFTTSEGEELVPLSDGTFRAENEGGFRRYHFDRIANVWTCDHADGTKTTFGADPFSRVEIPGRTARWYATRIEDTNGNRIELEYVPFSDSPGQVYPSRIYYTRHATQTLTGEHIVAFDWAPRPDPIHDFRFGFQMTTGRRLERIDACTRGGSFTPASTCDGVGVPGAARVRAYRVDYDDVGACQASVCARGLVGAPCASDAQCTLGASRLERVTQIGDDGVSELPPVELRYTDLELLASPSGPTWQLVASYPTAVAGSPDSALVDLNADGFPDVLESPVTQPGVLRRWLHAGTDPNGIVVFGPEESFPGPAERLSTPGTQLADLDGDGITDLLSRPSPGTPQFDVRHGTGAGTFALTASPFLISGLDSFASQGFEDPSVRLVDLDFDKRIDVLRTVVTGGLTTELLARVTLRVNGQDLLAPQTSCAALMSANFAGGKTFLVDMNGDRMLDVVVVQTSPGQVDQIAYYPATGGGGYGIGGSCATAGVPVVVGGDVVAGVTGADFTTFGGFRFEDLTGDGQADLLFLGPGAATLWINRGGDALRRIELGTYPAGIDYDACLPGCNPLLFDVVEIADLNGNGTPDVVLIDRESASVRYLDLVGPTGVPPNLLTSIDNGIGAVTTIEYEPSTRDYLDALAPGATPWRTRIPFPVTVVARKKVRFGLDLDGVPGEDEYLTEYRYRDGYYDGAEKEFRGFSEVELIARGDTSQPTLLTRHSFHTGAPDGVDNDADGLVDERSAEGGAEEESLKGMSLEVRRETCVDGPDGACATPGEIFDHQLSRWEIRTLYGATGKVCSGRPEIGCCSDADCSSAEIGGTCVHSSAGESGLFPTDACVAGQSVHWAVPTAQRTAVIEQGAGSRIDLMTESDFDGFGNPSLMRSWGIVQADSPPPFGCVLATGSCELAASLVCGSSADCGSAGPCVKQSSADGGALCDASDAFAFTNPAVPADDRLEIRAFGINEADWLLRCQTDLATTDAAGTIEAHSRSFYDGLPLGQCNAGNLTLEEQELIQESRWIARIRNVHDAFGNVVEVRDARGNLRSFEYDASLQTLPTREIAHLDGYTLSRLATYHEGFGVAKAGTTWAVTGLGPESRFAYDTFGRLVSQVDPGDSDALPTMVWVYRLNEAGDGISVLESHQRETAGGGMIDSYAFVDGLSRALGVKLEGPTAGQWIFSGAVGFDRRGQVRASWNPYFTASSAYEAPAAAGARSSTAYDALGRPQRTTHADGAIAETHYAPLRTDEYDENDLAGLTPGSFSSSRLDGLGRLVEVNERNGAELLSTLYDYDARGNLLRIEDAHGNQTLASYDSLSRRLWLNDPDRGQATFRYDDADNLVEREDAKQQRTVFAYDPVNRILVENYLDETGDPLTDPVDARFDYDIPLPGQVDLGGGMTGSPAFTAGELVRVIDRSGEEHRSYDARRRRTWTSKHIRDPLLEVLVPYTSELAYDSAGRLTAQAFPDGDALEFEYDSRGLLRRVRGANGGEDALTNVSYTASGQLDAVQFGNGVVTQYGYDDRLRLALLRTTGAGASAGRDLLHHAYAFDPASNITDLEDLRADVPPTTPAHDTQRLGYDGLHRLRSYRLSSPSAPAADFGSIQYTHDALDNLISQSSTIVHDQGGRTVTQLGALSYGGAGGTAGRIGRAVGAPPGPHAVTSVSSGANLRTYSYDDNGNAVLHDGRVATWDFEDRLVSLEDSKVRAEYVYDHADRRITKRVEWKQSSPGHLVGDVERTLYVDDTFELRPGAQSTKLVFLSGERVAEITRGLSPSAERIQRFDLSPGWNLVAIAVNAADTASRLGVGTSAISAAWRWDPASQSYLAVTPGTPLPAGTAVWLLASQSSAPSIRGSYSSPSVGSAPSGFVPLATLEAISIADAVSSDSTTWLWDRWRERWRTRVGTSYPPLTDAPALAPPASVLFTSPAPTTLELPPQEARIRFHHVDHLGSSNVISDGAGNVVEEAHFYPYGLPRVRIQGVAHGLPTSNHLYLGKELDEESSLYQLGARYYDPVVRSFASVDPLLIDPSATGSPRALNAYGYALANPVGYVDPTGMWPFSDDAWKTIKRLPSDILWNPWRANPLGAQIAIANSFVWGEESTTRTLQLGKRVVARGKSEVEERTADSGAAIKVVAWLVSKQIEVADFLIPASERELAISVAGGKLAGSATKWLSKSPRFNAALSKLDEISAGLERKLPGSKHILASSDDVAGYAAGKALEEVAERELPAAYGLIEEIVSDRISDATERARKWLTDSDP